MAREQKLLAVLIDADNIPAKYAKQILDEVKEHGVPALRRVYGDWSSDALADWKKEVAEHGMVLKQETANTKNKNASDIGLVIDAMDILQTGRFNGFVLVSSDSDFTALASRVREDGVEVFGIGERKTPPSLRNVCDRFIFIENIVASSEEETSGAEPKSRKEESVQDKPRQPPSKAVPLVLKAMKSIDPEKEWYFLGQLGQHITRAKPDFDQREYGNAKLSDLLEKTGQFELRRGGKDVEVRRKT